MLDFSGCVDDDSFGPAVRGCRDDFDFTIKFEKIFFSLIPTSIFIAVALARVAHLTRNPSIVGGSLLRAAKLIAISAYTIIQLALLILSITKSRKFASFFIPSDALALASALCMLLLSNLEHLRSPRPSILLSAYLFIALLFDIAHVRTLWLASTNSDELVLSRLWTSGVAVKASLIVLESQSKARWIVRWDVKEHSPEETSGLYGLGAYLWLNRLFLTGYRKILDLHDLFPLDRNMSSEVLQTRYAGRIDVRQVKGKHGLARALTKALAVPLLYPVGPRIALGAFHFCQPFLIETLLGYLERPASESSQNLGYGLIGASVLIYVGIAASGAFYWYYQERAMYMVRGLLVGTIYRATIEAELTAGGDSEALTLMSTDVERIISGCLNLHEFWANTIEVALACWLLSRQIGPAFVAPLIVIGACVVCSAALAKFTGPRQKEWMGKIQKRVGLTSGIIGQMKHLKISGLAEPVEESIQTMRVDELNSGARFRTVLVLAAVVGFTPLCLSPVITFAFAARTLDVTLIFTSISYITLLATPLGTLFQAVPQLLGALTCLSRIQAFLEKEAHADFRSFHGLPRPNQATAEEKPRPESLNSQTTAKVKVTNGNFGWHTEKLSLRDIDLEIPSSCLTIVVGPVASGKSTLCKALLGEIPVSQGEVIMAPNSNRKIGYCDQTPYLSNATIRENIVGFSPFDQQRYEEVIEATMLGPDLSILPQGDNTNVGSNGVTLSGGQKQRVSMARALYLDTDFYVFDDILSGLDADTEEQVFLRVFSSTSLIRRRHATAVLCTHSVRHLPSADHIIALGQDGTIVEQGTFQELLANEKYVHNLGVTERGPLLGDDSVPESKKLEKSALKALPRSKPTAASSKVEGQARATGDWAVYRHYFSRIGALCLTALVVLGIGGGFFLNFGTIWLKFWSEDVASPNPSRFNGFYNGVYALLQTGALASLFSVAMVGFRSVVNISGAKLHREALNTVFNAPLKFFTITDTGVVTNLFSQDMTLIDGQLPMAMINVILAAFACIGMAAVIATASPYLALTYPILFAAMYVLQMFYLRTSRQIRLLDLEAKSPLYSHFIDTIKGIATFRAFGWIQEGVSRNDRLLDTSQRPAYLLAMIQRWLGFTLQLIVAVLGLAVVTLSTQLRSNTAFTGASLVTLMAFGENLFSIIRFYTMLETSIGAVSRLKSFSENVKPESREGEDVVPPKEWPLKGAIQISGVSASYGSDDDAQGETASPPEHLALNDLHLDISPGEKVAICGRSGSGKSSLLLLLLRLLDPLPTSTSMTHPPEITIDSIPLSKIHRPSLRNRVIAIPQDAVFLPDGSSVQSNLDPLGQSTAADCRSALEAVGLWDFVASRGGMEAGMSPETFSQGQRQLFSLARAILRRRARARERAAEAGEKVVADGGVLLLDEVSSSVDLDTDGAMQRIIMQEFAGYTIVMVSHRLGMVMAFDRVVVMEQGRIVETGRPRELAELEGSRFRELWLVGNKGRS